MLQIHGADLCYKQMMLACGADDDAKRHMSAWKMYCCQHACGSNHIHMLQYSPCYSRTMTVQLARYCCTMTKGAAAMEYCCCDGC